ncbi:TPA: hypothetical protein NV714_003791 [Escherichia coli]|nr:hypothetical protein [Escherichia coli]
MRCIAEIIKDGNINELEEAIKKGININEVYTNSENETPIFYSSYVQTKLLIEAGANVNHLNVDNQNALFFLDYSFYHNTDNMHLDKYKKLKLLIDNNINVKQLTSNGENFLFFTNLNIDFLKMCENLNVNLKHINNDGENLFFGLNDFYKFRETREYLITKGLDLFKENNNGENLFFVENGNGNPQLIEYYLEKGLNINKKNNAGETALMKIKSDPVRNILIDNNIDIHVISNQGKNALDYCFHSEEIVKRLLDKNIEILQPETYYASNSVVSKMIEKKRMEYLILKAKNEKESIIKILKERNNNKPARRI